MADALPQVVARYEAFLRLRGVSIPELLQPAETGEAIVAVEEQLIEAMRRVEALATIWFARAEVLGLTPDEVRQGDVMAKAMIDLATSDDPPKSVLRSMAEWFAHKADLFMESAAESAGKVAGAAIGAAATYGVARATGTWDELRGLA